VKLKAYVPDCGTDPRQLRGRMDLSSRARGQRRNRRNWRERTAFRRQCKKNYPTRRAAGWGEGHRLQARAAEKRGGSGNRRFYTITQSPETEGQTPPVSYRIRETGKPLKGLGRGVRNAEGKKPDKSLSDSRRKKTSVLGKRERTPAVGPRRPITFGGPQVEGS